MSLSNKIFNYLLLVFMSYIMLNCNTAQDMELVTIESPYSVDETMDRLEGLLQDKGMTIFSVIDHAKGASDVGMELRTTQLIIFGNPKVGTKLMQCSQQVGIDLPLKFLVWEDENGQTNIGYYAPQSIKAQHDLSAECDGVIEKVSNALANFAAAASKKE